MPQGGPSAQSHQDPNEIAQLHELGSLSDLSHRIKNFSLHTKNKDAH